MATFRTFSNSTVVKIAAPPDQLDSALKQHEMMAWAIAHCKGDVEIWPHPPGRTSKQDFTQIHILCELAEDATLMTLRWAS